MPELNFLLNYWELVKVSPLGDNLVIWKLMAKSLLIQQAGIYAKFWKAMSLTAF